MQGHPRRPRCDDVPNRGNTHVGTSAIFFCFYACRHGGFKLRCVVRVMELPLQHKQRVGGFLSLYINDGHRCIQRWVRREVPEASNVIECAACWHRQFWIVGCFGDLIVQRAGLHAQFVSQDVLEASSCKCCCSLWRRIQNGACFIIVLAWCSRKCGRCSRGRRGYRP